MSAVTRWRIRRSFFLRDPARWLAYGKYGDRVVPGTARRFSSWRDAMDYVNEQVRSR